MPDAEIEQNQVSMATPSGLLGQVKEVITTVFDPEIPVNIYELGLIYNIDIDPAGVVDIVMTLTSPHCPAAASLPKEVEDKVRAVSGVNDVKVTIAWEPPWSPQRMSEAARLELGYF
jgi:FeS assembly SUF system protein